MLWIDGSILFRLENPASVHFLLKYHLGNAWLTNDGEIMGDKNLDFEYSESLEPEHLQTRSPSVLWGVSPILSLARNGLRHILNHMLQLPSTPPIRHPLSF